MSLDQRQIDRLVRAFRFSRERDRDVHERFGYVCSAIETTLEECGLKLADLLTDETVTGDKS